jgi:hypothetical protein
MNTMFKANESDLMMRLLDPLFDMTWSWTQTFDVSKTLDKLKKISTNDAASSRKSVLLMFDCKHQYIRYVHE